MGCVIFQGVEEGVEWLLDSIEGIVGRSTATERERSLKCGFVVIQNLQSRSDARSRGGLDDFAAYVWMPCTD